MKNLGYNILKYWLKIGLYCYYSKIVISGEQHIPVNKPILFLPNHQSALLDVLLVGIHCNRKPWFLTRSDVFKKPLFKKLFTYLQMIPIYRIRDGRNALKNNDAVFKKCAALLAKNEAIVIFPEANHNLKRRIRPLSKGFTRILFRSLVNAPNLDVQLVPVGLNYTNAAGFPDSVAINFGKPIAVKDLLINEDIQSSTQVIKDAVSNSLKKLTTHIADLENYDNIIENLNAMGADFLNPSAVNTLVHHTVTRKAKEPKKPISSLFGKLYKFLFKLVNFPLIFAWSYGIKPNIPEPEFAGTFRYAYSQVAFLVYYIMMFALLSFVCTPMIGLSSVFALCAFNWFFVKNS